MAHPAIKPPILACAICSPVKISTTPEDLRALDVSTFFIFALACGDLINMAYV